MVSVESQPFSSCAMASAAITADCFCSAGNLAISRSIFFNDSALSMASTRVGNRGQTTFFVAAVTRQRRETKNVVCPRFQFQAASPVDLAEDEVEGADDGDHVGDHVAARHLVQSLQMREAGAADLHAVGLVRAVGHDVNPELALGMLDRG